MGRKYTVTGGQEVDGSGGDDVETQLSLTNPADLVTRINRIRCGQKTHATAEMYLLELQRASTSGSGGSTPTPSKVDEGDAASTVTARSGPTTEPTYTANTVLLTRNWNSVLGMEEVWTPDEAPVISPSGIVGIKVSALNGTTVFTPDVEVEFEEIGG